MSRAGTACDVVIVGGGASGAVTATRLAESGYSVICLEQGDDPNYSRLSPDQPGHELNRTRYFSANPNRRAAPADYPIEVTDADIVPQMWNGVGGSTVLYAAAWHRMRPSDFRTRTVEGIGDDWPLAYADLAPYYQRVEADFGVSGVGGDPQYPDRFDLPMPPAVFGPLEQRLAEAHNRLGWHWWPGSNAIATARTSTLAPCVRRGTCMTGCTDGAKGSVDRTHWPRAERLGVRLIRGARALSVETDQRGLATGVLYVDRAGGPPHLQRASVVVLAANGVGTPRLLLASASKDHPDGLGNSSSGLLGKRLMMHPMSSVEGVFEDFFDSWQGPSGQRVYSLQFADAHEANGGRARGAKWQLMGSGSPLEVARLLHWRGRASWGEAFHREVVKRFGRSAFWTVISEDMPYEDNRVTLDASLTDAHGLAAPKITYRISDDTRRVLRFNEQRAAESLTAAGAYETTTSTAPPETGWHLLGTARMGDDPATSVVDPWGRAHDVPNLYVFDGSVFPTSGPVNPTGTIAALALRNTEALMSSSRFQPTLSDS
ncbi:GMC family oxidoreductase [Streptomyces sp. NBC_01288]|uniref:GMC family oxidoreductase n=1 Tax=Streptomyces sp. NBC_01288 TaxID=2903814 RepID=UPI002E14EC55|nr:GMC family oxidoreductase [Streptomyces sp. NBC_01288]